MMISIADIQHVFVDSSAWIDLMNRNEHHRAAAVAFHKSLAPMTLHITSWGIVSETFTWIRYHVGSHEAMRWLVLKETLDLPNTHYLVGKADQVHFDPALPWIIEGIVPKLVQLEISV